MKCSRCQQENPLQAKFCLECGAPLRDATGTEGSYAELRAEIGALRRSLSESLEQQTATSGILRVISQSSTDLQPVLEALAESAARLCDCIDAQIFRVDGEALRLAVSIGPLPHLGAAALVPLNRGWVSARATIDRQAVHIHDVQAETSQFPESSAAAMRDGTRTMLAVPLLSEDAALGAILIRRADVRPFSDKQIALLKTFADQAAIAIENVRLFTELQEKNQALRAAHTQVTDALDQQTATSEILSVISSSPTDVQPVFDTIVRSATRLCGADFGAVHRFDGTLLHLAAHYNVSSEGLLELHRLFPRPLDEGSLSARVLRDGRSHQNPDVQADADAPPAAGRMGRVLEYRSEIVLPMLRGTTPIGTLSVARRVGGLFPDRQVVLLQTFADQAVIAIENVRLFKELQEKNHALTTALEQQVATSEILRVISRSPTDVQPVFDTIVRNAARLCHATMSWIWLLEGDWLKMTAPYNVPPGAAAGIRVTDAQNATRVIREGTIHHIGDTEDDSRMTPAALREARTMGVRAALAVPMRRGTEPIGALTVYRDAPGTFSDTQVELLKTFADQAVIAIENVRLFKELQEKNTALTEAHGRVTEALDQQTATSEILRVIASSQTDVQPVFDAIVTNASASRVFRLALPARG